MTKNNKLALLLNGIMIILSCVGLYFASQESNMFLFYTNDSNILLLISCVVYILTLLIKKDVPFISLVLRFMASASLALTFVTIFYLASTYDGDYLNGLLFYFTNGSFLFFHLLNPIISVLSFTLFEGDRRLNKKKTIYLALIPTIVYALVLVILNVTGKVVGPYPFLMVERNSPLISIISAVIILVLNYLLARFILLFNQKHSPRRKRKEA